MLLVCVFSGYCDVKLELLIGNMKRWDLEGYNFEWQIVCVCVCVSSVNTEV